MARQNGEAAYVIVDLSTIEDGEVRQMILDDANAGGAGFGIRIVEAFQNGPATTSIYGYYKSPNPDEENWNETKAEYGLSVDAAEAADDNAVREAAAGTAQSEADLARAAEEGELGQIVADDKVAPVANKLKK